jgi:ribosomal protein S18 acetylase RimI-like enzyme
MSDRLDLPEGLAARGPEPGDAPAVFALIEACEAMVQDQPDIQLEDIVADWRRPSFDLAADAILVLEGDRLVGEAEVFKGRRAEVAVHPTARGRGIGTALLGWTERRSRATGGSLVGQTVPDADTGAVELFRANGYEPMWRSWVLSYAIDGPPQPPELPEGYSFRPFELGRDDRDVYEVVERAFSEWPDRDPYTYEDWRAGTVDMESFDPALQIVIDREGEVVGAANLIDPGAEGWVHQLAVGREHRGRGLGRALLQQAFVRFHARGRASVGLSTDSRTGALGLYEHVGMRVTRSYTHHAKHL